ncbi:MAG: glycoside hydrolase family 3 N-terminal domain-containing protein [Kiritimatiellia bacterium]
MLSSLVLAAAVTVPLNPISIERRAEAEARAAALIAELSPSERLAQLMMGAPGVDRLGIRPYHWWNEALHGVARAGLATVFPQSMAAAATFDAKLQREVGAIVSTEARAKYNLFRRKGDYGIYRGLTMWSPNVNMFRDPRWGRGQETFGEDPYLAGVLGGAYVCGLQGDDAKYLKTAACAKHFAVHSGPEKLRHGFDARVSPRDLAEYYLPAFKMLVTESKVESVMGAYSAINGIPCCANKWLLTDLLRGEWGFQGHVVSDVGAVNDIFAGHKQAADRAAASRAAMAAGLDLCSENTYASLSKAVDEGAVAAAELEAPLRRLFTTRALLGCFDPVGATPWDRLGAQDVATEASRAVARRMAEESIVLISNQNHTLPIDRAKTHGLAIVGPQAKNEVALLGNYCGFTDRPVTCMSGFAGVAGAGVRVTDEQEFKDSDVIIACIGITADDEGEEGCSLNNSGADRTAYGIPLTQLKMLRNYRQKHPKAKLIAVVFGCSPFDLAPVTEICDAVLLVWYPGEQGGTAIARVVFGDVNPSGRLPITFPKSYDDLPPFEDYTLKGRTYRYAEKAPLYPFGYGLSYTTFAYANEKVGVEGHGQEEMVTVSVDVTNTGKVAGDEVVQLYVRSPKSAEDRRRHHLEGFARISLKAGETKTVQLTLKATQLAQFDAAGRETVASGNYEIFVGGGQPGYAANVVSTLLKR